MAKLRPAPPILTPDQRRAALAKAAQVRMARAMLLAALKAGDIDLATVLGRDDEVTRRVLVHDLLRSLPSIGPAKARILMEQIGISRSRRIRGLGSRQRTALLEHFIGH